MKPAFQPVRFKTGSLKNLSVRQKINLCSRLLRLSDHRQQPIHQLYHRQSSLVSIMMNPPAPVNLNVHMNRQRIDHRRSHSMKPSAGLIGIIVKLPPCMKGGKHDTRRRHPLLMHLNRNSPSAVLHRTRTIRLQNHLDLITISCQVLIYRIVHNLINQMVQPLGPHSSYVHAWPLPDCFQTLQDGNAVRIILCLRH